MRVVKHSFEIICLFGLFVFVTPAIAQTGQSQLFKRIYDGDYVWSQEFPREEAALVGYGMALLNEIQNKCPDVISQSENREVDNFFLTMAGIHEYAVEGSVLFPQAVKLAGSNVALRSTAAKDLSTAMLESESACNGPKINRVGENVWRMLAGRRPLYRSESAKRLTFIKQSIGPIDTYHQYPGIGNSLAGGTARRVFERHVETMNGYGLTVLECRYDEEPGDGIEEEQYYWGPSVATLEFSPMMLFWQTILSSFQESMDTAMGPAGRGIGRVIHPFTTYGSPRSECPSLRDPGLHVRKIEVDDEPAWNYQKGPCVMQDDGVFDCP